MTNRIARVGQVWDSTVVSISDLVIDGVVAEYNGRQGLSWIGGNGLVVTGSRFSHTGKAVHIKTKSPFFSAPGAGLDIDPNPGKPQWTSGGKFVGCEFRNNVGSGVLAPLNVSYPDNSPDGGYTSFDKCVMAWYERRQCRAASW